MILTLHHFSESSLSPPCLWYCSMASWGDVVGHLHTVVDLGELCKWKLEQCSGTTMSKSPWHSAFNKFSTRQTVPEAHESSDACSGPSSPVFWTTHLPLQTKALAKTQVYIHSTATTICHLHDRGETEPGGNEQDNTAPWGRHQDGKMNQSKKADGHDKP